MTEDDDLLHNSDARLLAMLVDAAGGADRPWLSGELAGVLRHQLRSPLAVDLAADNPELQASLQTLALAVDPPIRTFGELLKHPDPPIELLRCCHRFAKRHIYDPHGPIPAEIAGAIYYSAILAARRRGVRLSTLTDQQLTLGITWLVAQPWLDVHTSDVLLAALKECTA